MDIRVRTQSKVSLTDCTSKNIALYGRTDNLNSIVAISQNNVELLGEYETEERATEVLELIQEVLEKAYYNGESGIVIQMPEE